MTDRNQTLVWAAIVLGQLIALNSVTFSAYGIDKKTDSADESNVLTPSSDRSQESTSREAIFRDRKQLLAILTHQKTRSQFCAPARNDSYDLFQSSVQEELDVLWNLDIYASKYGL